MRVDSQFFIPIAVSMKEPDLLVGNSPVWDGFLLYFHLCFMPLLENTPWQSTRCSFQKKSDVLTQTQLLLFGG